MKDKDNESILDSPAKAKLALIRNRWKILILRVLLCGTRRFGELKNSFDGITQKVFTANLREMVAKAYFAAKDISRSAAPGRIHADLDTILPAPSSQSTGAEGNRISNIIPSYGVG